MLSIYFQLKKVELETHYGIKHHPEDTRRFKHNLKKDLRALAQLIEGSLEVKLPTIWTDEKQSREEAERRERLEERRVEEKE